MGSWVRGGGQASFTRMSWTWTGYDYDPVFRYKDEATFFQTGRNNAEARFWQTKIHEGDRRGTKSQIEIGSDGDSVKDHADVTKESSEDSASKDDEAEYEEEDDVRSLGDRDYQYGYGGGRDPGQRYFVYEETRHDGHKGRDRTMSIVSTISRKDDWRSPSKDYQYSYGEDAVEVERPPARGSVERQRGSVERQRVSVERKLKKQSEERPRQSEESSRQTDDRPRQADERYRQTEGTKREERQTSDRRSEEYERYKEPDQQGRYKREADEGYIERGRDEEMHRHRDDEEEGRAREKQPERIADWDRRPNVNRRKVHGHRGQQCAQGGDFTGSSYY